MYDHHFQYPNVREITPKRSSISDTGYVEEDMKEQVQTYGLAAVGAVEGAWRYAVQPEITARRGWIGLAALITAYELVCPPGQTLSEGVDRAIETHPLITTAAIGYTALHLLNVLPSQVDLFSQVTDYFKH